SGWTLEQLEGDVRGSENNATGTQTNLAPGDFARVGAVWVTVVEEGADWEDPPPEPAASAQDHDGADGPLDDMDDGEEEDDGMMAVVDEYADDAGQARPQGALDDDDLVEEAADAAVGAAAAGKPRSIFSARRLMWPVGLVAVLSVAAYAMGTKSDPKEATRRAALASLQDEKIEGHAKPGRLKSSLAVATPPGMPNEALRQAFRARLAEVDLLKKFNLTLNDDAWEMQASLDEDDAARFKRILETFIASNHIKFPVAAKIGTAEALLPFKIQQVISGANASIVTDDGNRMYIGDEYQGMRLVAIAGNRLSFTGKRTMEVKW
ncbi:MAG: hypothetical protein ACRYGK_03915, partial [Janthinobacterium lividum]